jgi:shikimate dehydrogenase
MKDVYTLGDLQGWKEATADEEFPIRLGVLGDPVAQSLSPPMQNAGLEATGIGARYARFQISPNELEDALGCSVGSNLSAST